MEKEPRPNYEIREATLDDVESIRRMQAQSWRDTYRNDAIGVTEQWLAEETASWLTPEALEKSREHFRKILASPTDFYRVALRGSEVVGLLHLATHDDGSKYLWGLYTAKETHGTGLAQQLMALADEWIGDKAVDLGVASYNERAKAFYRKNGFHETDKVNDLFRDMIPETTMRREAKL